MEKIKYVTLGFLLGVMIATVLQTVYTLNQNLPILPITQLVDDYSKMTPIISSIDYTNHWILFNSIWKLVVSEIKTSKIIDKDNTNYYIDPSSTGTSIKVAGTVDAAKVKANQFCIGSNCITSWNTGTGLPSKGCMIYNGANCPTGWIHLGDAEVSSSSTLTVKISNPNTYPLTNFQVRIDLSSKIPTPTNLLVCRDPLCIGKIPYCFEQPNGECKSSPPTKIIWVKIPNIPAGSSVILYIYKSPTNYASNGDEVFDFYDDFDSGTIDTSKWYINHENNGGSFSIGYGNLIYSGDNFCPWCITWGDTGYTVSNYLRSNIVFKLPILVEAKVRSNTLGYMYEDIILLYNNPSIWISVDHKATPLIVVDNKYKEFGDHLPNTNYHIIKYLLKPNSISVWLDWSKEWYTWSVNIPNEGWIGVAGDPDYIGSTVYSDYWEWIRVRKYADKEPTISLSGTLESITNVKYYPVCCRP